MKKLKILIALRSEFQTSKKWKVKYIETFGRVFFVQSEIMKIKNTFGCSFQDKLENGIQKIHCLFESQLQKLLKTVLFFLILLQSSMTVLIFQ
jgi:hypothetical protein